MNIQFWHNQLLFCHTIELKQTYITLNNGIVRTYHKIMQTNQW